MMRRNVSDLTVQNRGPLPIPVSLKRRRIGNHQRNLTCLLLTFLTSSYLWYLTISSQQIERDLAPFQPYPLQVNNGIVSTVHKLTSETKTPVTKPKPKKPVKIDGLREERVRFLREKIQEYGQMCKKAIETDSAQQGLSNKYVVLKGKNQLANKLRGLVSLFFYGMITGRCFFTDLKERPLIYELHLLWEDPGYPWDILTLPRSFAEKILDASKRGRFHSYDFATQRDFELYYCSNLEEKYPSSVVSIATFTYPLPILLRNTQMMPPDYQNMFPSTDPFALEILELTLVRSILKPVPDLKQKILERRDHFLTKANEYAEDNGIPPSDLILAGTHIRSEYVVWMSVPKGKEGNIKSSAVRKSYKMYKTCIEQSVKQDGGIMKNAYVYVATDSKDSQNLAADVFGDQAYVPAEFVPAAQWEGIYDAVIDFHLAGSFDHLVFTPHSSFSEFTALTGIRPDNEQWIPPRPLSVVCTEQEWELDKLAKLMDGRAERLSPQCDAYTTAGVSLQDFTKLLQSSSCYDEQQDPSV